MVSIRKVKVVIMLVITRLIILIIIRMLKFVTIRNQDGFDGHFSPDVFGLFVLILPQTTLTRLSPSFTREAFTVGNVAMQVVRPGGQL